MRRIIAIVEDESVIRANYADALHRQGYSVKPFAAREEALVSFKTKLPDLVLLDIGLGDDIEGGFELCRELRGLSTTLPIIFLTARDSDFDAISGLRLGADEYLTKDISLPHLCARIAALFRRMDALKTAQTAEERLERGALNLDVPRLQARWQNLSVDLSLTEFWIIYALAKFPGHVKNREQLMQEANIVVDDATITSHIKRIRKKFLYIDPQFNALDTVYGIGYRWNM